MDKPIKFYKRRTYILFFLLILMIGYYVQTDIISLIHSENQQDTIIIQTMTIKELNYKILETYDLVNKKEIEIKLLKQNVKILKKAVREKRGHNSINIIDTESIMLDTTGNIIKIGN